GPPSLAVRRGRKGPDRTGVSAIRVLDTRPEQQHSRDAEQPTTRAAAPWSPSRVARRDLGHPSRTPARSDVRRSVIALAADHVERPERRDDIAQHGAVDEIGQAL